MKKPEHAMIGPTDIPDGGKIITYCTPLGAARLTRLPDGTLHVEFTGIQPFTLSDEGVDAFRGALDLFEEGRP